MNDEIKPTEDNEESLTESIDPIVNAPSEEEAVPNVIYKKEKPGLKVLIWTIVGIFISTVLIFGTGFVMGLMKIEPPRFDSKIIEDKLHQSTSTYTPPVTEAPDTPINSSSPGVK